MKKIIAGVTLLLLTSCVGKKEQSDPFASIIKESDSVTCTHDSLSEQLISDEQLSAEVDDSFGDFFYNFSSDDVLQRKRICFPLQCNTEGVLSEIDESAWKYDDLFLKQGYYTLLFERESDMDLVDTDSMNQVRVECFFLAKQLLKSYYFERQKGIWMLQSIEMCAVNRTKKREDFITFFKRFSTDSLFQTQRIHQPLQFVTIDPDDDFSIIETTLGLEQWFAFKPTLPIEKLSNINYGQQNKGQSPYKIVALKGLGNGFSNILYFHFRDGGGWELYKFEDTSI